MEKSRLINQVIELHRRVNHSLRFSSQDAWMQLSLTVPQVKSLFFITDQGTTNFKNLAVALKVTQSNLTGVIDRLVEQNMVSRTENPDDRRMVMLQATEQGETLVSDLRERRISQLSQALADLSPEDLDSIVTGLSLLARVIESPKPERTL
jgi:MarR family transcriptional regulator, organic hydroperoxide resistance regulator